MHEVVAQSGRVRRLRGGAAPNKPRPLSPTGGARKRRRTENDDTARDDVVLEPLCAVCRPGPRQDAKMLVVTKRSEASV